ncbi:MAG: tetratricopeptide repeat protein [Verrucomicrobiales bacterium]|nr:tetratricopeptide repeat protein [Verrucomicrobiales bacterium]
MIKPTSLLVLPLLVLSLLIPCGVTHAQSFKAAYDEGVRLYDAGNYEEALARFEIAVRANPRSPHARSYMIKSKTAVAQGLGSKKSMEKDLAKIIIPQINFEDAPIGDVLQYLAARTEELTQGKLRPNIIYKGSPEQRQNTLITLSVRNVPVTEALRYVGQISRTHFKYEEHAVVADPNWVAPPNPKLQAAEKAAAEANTDVFSQPAKNVFD